MSDDLIRRSDAIDELMHIIPYKRYHNGEYVLLLNKRECLKAIKAIPSAERPQGKWEVSCRDSVCSVCGKDEAEFICGTEDWYGYGLSNYCPNCGARMKGADDEIN